MSTPEPRPPAARMISDSMARWLTRFGILGGPIAAATLTLLAWIVGIPKSGYAGFWETVAQVTLLVVYAIGSFVALRFRMTGATIMTVTAFAIGALSAVKFHPLQGLFIALGLFAPAGALWLVWQRRRRWPAIAALAGVLVAVMAISGYAADYLFTYFYGPQTPQASVSELPESTVDWIWSGGVTARSATIVARSVDDEARMSLVYSTDRRLVRPVTVDADQAPSGALPDGVHRFTLPDLAPATTYYYAAVVDGVRDTKRTGQLRTFADGPMSMSIAFAACARLNSNAQVFATVASHAPDLYLATGDWFYGDIATDDPDLYLRDYTTTLTRPAQSQLYRSTPIAYMWDDHDYGPNDGDRTSPSRPAALESYRALVPHYPLGMSGAEAPIAQAFTIGRVRVILTDLRSARDPKTDPDDAAKSMTGDEQLIWFERELQAANGRYPVILWVSSVPWIDRSTSPGDDWGAYTTERARIADFIAKERIQGLVMLAGDAHMVAADDGTNSNFSSTAGPGFPVLQAAAVDRPGSSKGGPYSEGLVEGGGHYGWLDITDSGGDRIDLSFEGRTYDDQVLITYSGSFPATPMTTSP